MLVLAGMKKNPPDISYDVDYFVWLACASSARFPQDHMSCSPSITYIISISHTIYMKYCYLAHSPGVSNNYKVIAFSLNRFLNVSQKKTKSSLCRNVHVVCDQMEGLQWILTLDYCSFWLRIMSSLLHSSLNLLKNNCKDEIASTLFGGFLGPWN